MNFSPEDIKRLQTLDIQAVVLFGSQALGTARQMSDYDVFVIGPNTKQTYDALYDMLSNQIKTLTNIDIVFDADAPLELKHHVATSGQVLYQKNPSVFADFREKVMREYADFAPHRAIFSNATLSRVQL